MSRDFLSVSSILQAVKSAAADASYGRKSQRDWINGTLQHCTTALQTDVRQKGIIATYNVCVLVIAMDEPKFVIVDASCIEGPDWPGMTLADGTLRLVERNSQLECLSRLIDPLYAGQPQRILPGRSDPNLS